MIDDSSFKSLLCGAKVQIQKLHLSSFFLLLRLIFFVTPTG